MKKLYFSLNKHILVSSKSFRLLFMVLMVFLSVNFVNAQGTNCAGSTPITIGNCITGNISISDNNQTPPNIGVCSGTFQREGWYTFTVAGGPLNVTITGMVSNRNLYLQLISQTGTCTGLSQINCANTDSGSGPETINATNLANGVYYVKVVSVGTNANMNLTSLCVTAVPTISSFTPGNSCPNTTPVVITGTNFTAGATVTFGGTNAASVTVNSSTQITATPAAGSTGTIKVTTPSGTATSTGTFTVNTLSTVPTGATGTTTICNGQNTTLTVAGGTVGTGAVAEWFTGSCAGTSAGTGNSINVSPTTTTTYYVRYAGTCNTTTCASVTVTVENPVAAAGTITGASPVCQGNTGIIYTVPPIANATGYDWTLPPGGSITAGANTNSITVSFSTTASSGNVTVSGKNSCGNGASYSLPVTVNPLIGTTGTITGTSPVCQAQNGVAYSIPAIANATTYNWILPAGATIATGANTEAITVNFASNAVSGTITVQGSNSCGNGTIASFPVTVNQVPVVTTQPEVTQTVCATGSVSFTIAATGGNLTFQWYKGATLLTGATGTTLTLNSLVPSDSAPDYHCIVTNNCTSTSSSNAALIVNEMPVIPNQTASVCSDDAFTVTPTNGVPTAATIVPSGTTYTWSLPVVTGGMTGGVAGSGASITGTLHNITTNDQTATYTVTPTSGTTGSCVGNTFTVVVTVKPSPSILNINATVCSGELLTVSPAPGGGNIVPPGTTYSWTAPSSALITGATAASGQASFTQTLVNTTNAPQIITYAVTATYGGCVDNTFSIFVTVNPKPTSAGNVATQSICTGSAIAPITISNPNTVPGTVTYSWTRDNTTNVSGIPNGSGTTITGNLTNGTGIQQPVIFSLYATSDKGCISLASTVTVLVDPAPTVAATPLTQTICSESPISAINITNPNGVAGTTFTWSRDNTTNITGIPSSGTAASITGSLTNTTNVQQTTTFTVGTVNNSCNSPTTTVSVIVNPKPTVAVSLATQTVCGGLPFTTINITNPNSVAGTTFTWSRDNTTNLTGVANTGNGTAISGTFVNNTNVQQIATFTITATAAGCFSTTTATVTVDPTPLLVITPATPAAICTEGTMSALGFTNSNGVTGVNYTWTRDKTTEITGLLASGSGNIPSTILTNTTTVSQTVTFTVTATAGGCSSTKTVAVTVYAPLVAPVIGNNQTACLASTPTALTSITPVSGGRGNYTYQWQRSDDNVTFTNIGGATNATYQPPQIPLFGADNIFYRLIVTDQCGNVTSNVVAIQPANNGSIDTVYSNLPGNLCPGSTFTSKVVSTHFAFSAVRYGWSADANYVTPATGGPTGTTGAAGGFLNLFRDSTGNIGTLTVQNNTNATVISPVVVTPYVYNYNATGPIICTLETYTINVTIYPKPTVTPTVTNTTICSASGSAIALKGNVTDAPTTFTWTRNNTASVTGPASGNSGAIAAGTTYTIPDVLTNTTAAPVTVTYLITPTANGCPGTQISVALTVAPSLTPGTVGTNQTICTGGDPAAFTESVAAIGSGVSYQWQSSTGSATGPWTNITSATAATYDAPSGLTQTTWYQRVITSTLNGVTCAVANAVPIQVTVNTIATGSVTGDQTICSGGDPTAFGSVAATGGGVITYQWQSNTTGCAGTWSDIGGATAAIYDAPTGLSVTTYYRRIAISTLNGKTCSDYSNCITVLANNVTAGTVSGDQTTCSANPTAFTESVASTGTGVLTYQWQSNTTGCGGAWADISGATGTTLAPSGLVGTTYYHRITISTLNGVSCSAISNCITVTINSVTAGAIASNRTVCSGGDPAAFTEAAAATGTALTYQWQMSTNSGLGPWTSITSATNPTYDAPALTQTTFYQRIAYSTIGGLTCSAASNSVTVFVNDVTAAVMAGSQSVCDVADPVAFTVSTAATGVGTLTYQWQSSTGGCSGPWNAISGATSATYDVGPLTQTTYYQVVVTSTLNAVQCTAISNCLVVTYNPNLPVALSIAPSANPICSGTSVTFTATPTNGGPAPIYQWKLNGVNVGSNLPTYTNATLANNDSVTCIMTSNATCATGNPVTSTPVVMTVNTTPVAPTLTNITLTCGQATAIETWAAVPNTTEYRFDLSLDSSFGTFITGYQNLLVSPLASPSVTLNSLASNVTYYVRVRTVTSCGVSPDSNVVTLSVPVTTTLNGSTWDNGTPDVTKRAVFAGNASITTPLTACSCQINSGANVVVGVSGGANADAVLKVENELNVVGTLTFENNASLIQVNDAAVNTGTITYKRNTAPMKNYDFTYWSSPVKNQILNVLSPNTLIDKYFSWANGNWVYENGGSNMNPPGKGFLIRVPKPDVTYPNGEYWTGLTYVQAVRFIGEPYNGNIPIATQPDGGYNLIGNPYPSPIDADSFIDANATIINGGLRFWTHNSSTTQSGNFYVYNSNDYATYNKTGATAATTGGPAPNGKIAAGQSFFVVASAGQSFTFNNAMRNTAKILATGSNNQFFRMAETKQATETEKSRVWLNFANSEGAFKQLLVGYVTGATNEMDRLYDSSIFGGNDYVDFYSINKDKNLTIQGRALPFEVTDKIPLGYKTTIKSTFTIAIDKVDGVLLNQDVFLEDKIKGTITDLKKGPYSFSSEIGNFNDRFVLRFTNTNVTTNPLGTVEVDDTKNPTLVAVKSKQIKVSSFDETIDKVKIYDLKTTLIYEKENVNSNELLISDLNSSDQFLIMKILLKNGKWITKKILF